MTHGKHDVSKKYIIFQDPRHKISVPPTMKTTCRKMSSKRSKQPEKNNCCGQMLGPRSIGLSETLSQMLIRSRRSWKYIWTLCCEEYSRQLPQSLSDFIKEDLFSGLGEERRTPGTTSHPLDHGSTWYLRDRHLHSLASPDTKRVGRELVLCRDRRPIIAWAVFDQHVDNFQCESENCDSL